MRQAKPTLFRDPVHDTVAWQPDSAEGALVLGLVDTAEVQRLRRIRQLGLSNLVYHGAEHSRFAHSMGVTWVARQMLDQVARHTAVAEEDRLVTLAAALLHDVGHGPMSHAFEAATGVRHEVWTLGIIEDPATGVHRVLSEVSPAMPGKVAARIRGDDDGAGYLQEIVSSQLDADRLDYIARDGHATGVGIGSYDFTRILAMLDIVDDGHLAVHQGAQEAVEGYLLSRFHMYKQVYLHKAVRSAERMLERALTRAAALHRDGDQVAGWPEGPLGRLLAGEALDHPAFVQMDDYDVWTCLKRWASAEDRVLRDLAGGLVNRRLWKVIRLPPGEAQRELRDQLTADARAIAERRGLSPDYHVLFDTSRDSPYRPYAGEETPSRSIRMSDGVGGWEPIEDRSPIVQMLGRLVHRQHLLCCHPEVRDEIRAMVDGATRPPRGLS